MIVWLASYPRSGNTLLRTLLYQVFGLKTVADEPGEARLVSWTEESKEALGYAEVPGSWDDYYRQALASPSLHLVKTHRPPVDNAKAIYVVRDGRSACVSYARYHAAYVRDGGQGLLGLIAGSDYYGGWSDHVQRWTRSPDQVLVLRYEQLVDADAGLVRRIADFLGLAAPSVGWSNPFERLARENPAFFREGRTQWARTDDWTDEVDAIFFAAHGALMVELGYATAAEAREAAGRLSPALAELVAVSHRISNELGEYRLICAQRQVVIDHLKQVCDERLALINEMSGQPSGQPATVGGSR